MSYQKKGHEQKMTYFYDRYNFNFQGEVREAFYLSDSHPFSAFIKKIDRDCLVLDAGCGTGFLTRLLSKRTECKIIGMDLSWNSLKAARGAVPEADFIRADVLQLPFKDTAFERVISNGVIHHTSDPFLAFSELIRVTKDNGLIYLSLYNKHRSYYLMYNLVGGFLRLFRPEGSMIKKVFYPIYKVKFRLYRYLSTGKWDNKVAFFNHFADAYLTPVARFYTIDQIAGFAEKNGLRFLQVASKRAMLIFVFKKA